MRARAINVKTGLVAAVAALLLLVGAGAAYASGDDSSAQPTGANSEKAESAALDHSSTTLTVATLRTPRSATKKVTTSSRSEAMTAANLTSTSTGTSTSSPRRQMTKAPTTKTSPTTTRTSLTTIGTSLATTSIQVVLEGPGEADPAPSLARSSSERMDRGYPVRSIHASTHMIESI